MSLTIGYAAMLEQFGPQEVVGYTALVRRGRPRRRQGPRRDAAGAAAAPVVGPDRRAGARQRDDRVAQRRHGVRKADIRSPHDFAQMAKLVRPGDVEGRMVISSDPDVHRAHIQRFVDLGFDRVYLHNVGRNQEEWIEVFGRDVLPRLTR